MIIIVVSLFNFVEKTAAEGETMSVVLDIQMKELKKQMDELRSERDSLIQQVSKLEKIWGGGVGAAVHL